MAPAGGSMLGMSRTVQDGKMREHEYLMIVVAEDGRIVYRAHPSGQSQTDFPLARLGKREVVFENLDHDFPQRIIYRLDASGDLVAAIEGSGEGGPKRIEWRFKRMRPSLTTEQARD